MTAFRRNGRWSAKYVQDGVQRWVPGGPWQTKREALAAEHEHRQRGCLERDAMTCAAWAGRWVVEFPRRSPSTRKLYEDAARRFAREFGELRLRDLDRMSSRTWALGQPRGIVHTVSTMLSEAKSMGLLEVNPFRDLRLPAVEQHRTLTIPTPAQVLELERACRVLGGYGPEFAAMIDFAAWTGVRQGELFALDWGDVHHGSLTVQRSRQPDGTLGPTKNRQTRTIPLLPPAQAALTVADQSRRPDNLLWHTARGRRLTKGTHSWPWTKVRATANLNTVRWHDLRHYCASRLLDLGLSPYDTSLMLGHTDGGTLVIQRYGHPDQSRVHRRIRAAFDLGAGELLPAETMPAVQRFGSSDVA